MAKTNVTLTLDDALAREAKVLAAQRGTSLSQLVAEQIELLVRRSQQYEIAKRRAMTRLSEALPLQWQRPATRDELHERR